MMSLPTRGAWIEIPIMERISTTARVAPHAGSVDRNNIPSVVWLIIRNVAPHAGSVDRNIYELTNR